MEILERIWEFLGIFFGGLAKGVEQGITSIFGSANARKVKRLGAKVEQVNALEPEYEALSDDQLRGKTEEFRARLLKGETLDDILVEAFAVCREAGKRYLDMRHYDVQLLGGMVLHTGWIAEMVTGEGKTLVATLPAYLNAIEGKGVHVITVNDYLARRDMEWMGPLYIGLGLTVGAIQSDMPVDERQKAYACDITYGTNNEFGFDYLRDNMRPAARGDDHFAKRYQQSQGPLNYAVIDEVDNILIDEARTPLIISGPAAQNVSQYAEADSLARKLKKGEHFEVNEKDHTVNLTDTGVREAEKLAGVESFYTAGNMHWPHLIDNALKAHHLYELDVRYVVEEGRVIIVDEFTGRKMEGRQWSDGLHQAVEAKEGVKIKEETQTLATITLQNFFKLYKKLCGMTGTAMTEAGEFWKIYQLDVVAIPTNREMQRLEFPDRIYSTEEEKWEAVAHDVERVHKWDVIVLKDDTELWGTIVREREDSIEFKKKGENREESFEKSKIDIIERKGRPVLVGTTSIEKSERLSALLERRGIKHSVLNAKHHKREAEIVAQAGRHGSVTLATNMAGRGTDIVLGGNPETMAWARLQDTYATRLDVPREEWDALVEEIEVAEGMKEQGKMLKELGGLYVMGTERHESRRIDLQLRGRTGRQGDPGSSRFYLSLEDDLMRIFAGPWAQKIMKTLGLPEGEPIESRMVTRRIEAAQKKVEERNFEIRKNLLEYDEVMDEQRKRVYSYRQKILDGYDCKQLILDMIEEQIDYHLSMFLQRDYGVETFARWAGSRLSTELEARDFRGMEINAAQDFAIEEAERAAETFIIDALEENLNVDEDPTDWNWEALVKSINARWNVNLRDRDLKKVGREGVAELVIDQARKALESFDLSEGTPYLEEDYGLKTALGWLRNKFGIEIAYERVAESDAAEIKQLALEQAEAAYAVKETEYPVMAGLYRYSVAVAGGQTRIDRDQLLAWARERFDTQLDEDTIKNKQRDELRELLLQQSEAHRKQARAALDKVEEKIDSLYSGASPDTHVRDLSANGAVTSLSQWVEESLHGELPPERLEALDREELELKLRAAVDEHYRPEMRRMERALLLQIVDAAWKDHLLAMDHLRSAVGLVGYAQVDPKVEYKREGMKLFEQVWNSIGQRVTDLIFRMEQLDERFVGSTWVESKAVHESAQSTSEIARQQQAAIDNMQGGDDPKIQPIRNAAERIGRNEPCPCGSGKKYKNCCMRAHSGS